MTFHSRPAAIFVIAGIAITFFGAGMYFGEPLTNLIGSWF